MGKLKCEISHKRLIVERNGRKFGTRGTTVHIGRVLLMPDSLSLVWGHSVHFAKFPLLRFSKGYCSPSFHSISTKFYCKYVGHEGIQGVAVFGDVPKCVWLGVLQCICRVLLMPDSLSLVWGHSVHFAKFSIPLFSKLYSFNSFHQNLTKLHNCVFNIVYQSIIIWGWYRLLHFWAICQKLKILWHFEIFLNTGPYGAGNFKRFSSYSFIWCQPNFMRTLATMAEYRLSLFLAIGQVLKILWHFEISTCESMGKPKMLNISKTADRRAKRTKMWDSVYYSAHR